MTIFFTIFQFYFQKGPNEDGEIEKQTKHLFAKVPLKDDPNFASVNEREKVMLTTVLPQMQEYLDTECEGFFRLPMPEVIYCYYDGKGEILRSFKPNWIWVHNVPNSFIFRDPRCVRTWKSISGRIC